MPKLPKFEEWTPPWGTDDEQLDVEKVKKLIYDLKADKEHLQGKVSEITTERDDFKQQLEAKEREGESEADKLKRERDEAVAALAAKPDTDVERLKLEVALEKGLTLVQAKRLLGTTKEELAADADDLVKSFGGNGAGAEDEDGNEDGEEETPRGRPRQLRNPGDPKPDAGAPLNVDKALESIPRF